MPGRRRPRLRLPAQLDRPTPAVAPPGRRGAGLRRARGPRSAAGAPARDHRPRRPRRPGRRRAPRARRRACRFAVNARAFVLAAQLDQGAAPSVHAQGLPPTGPPRSRPRSSRAAAPAADHVIAAPVRSASRDYGTLAALARPRSSPPSRTSSRRTRRSLRRPGRGRRAARDRGPAPDGRDPVGLRRGHRRGAPHHGRRRRRDQGAPDPRPRRTSPACCLQDRTAGWPRRASGSRTGAAALDADGLDPPHLPELARLLSARTRPHCSTHRGRPVARRPPSRRRRPAGRPRRPPLRGPRARHRPGRLADADHVAGATSAPCNG